MSIRTSAGSWLPGATGAAFAGAGLLGAILLTATSSFAAADKVHVSAGELTERIVATLEEELPDASFSAAREEADLLVRLRRAGGVLRLEVRDRSGTILLAREIAVTGGLAPALRVAVFLVSRAAAWEEVELPLPFESVPGTRIVSEPLPTRVERAPPPPDRIVPSPVRVVVVKKKTTTKKAKRKKEKREEKRKKRTEKRSEKKRRSSVDAVVSTSKATSESLPASGAALTRGIGLSVEAAFPASWWQRPFTPQLGLALAVRLEVGRWRVGAFGALLGVPCCGRSTASIEASATEVLLLADGFATLWRTKLVAIGGYAAAGIDILDLTAQSRVYAGPGSVEKMRMVQGIAILGIGLDIGPARGFVRGSLRVGALGRFAGNTRLSVPSPYPGADRPLDAGRVVPWATVAVSFRLR